MIPEPLSNSLWFRNHVLTAFKVKQENDSMCFLKVRMVLSKQGETHLWITVSFRCSLLKRESSVLSSWCKHQSVLTGDCVCWVWLLLFLPNYSDITAVPLHCSRSQLSVPGLSEMHSLFIPAIPILFLCCISPTQCIAQHHTLSPLKKDKNSVSSTEHLLSKLQVSM